MLVVSANWMFGDGTLAVAAAAPHVAVWLQAVHRAAVRAGFRRDGSYRPLDHLQVVLAGDTFDCLTSAAWTGSVRPWHDGRAAQAARRAVLVQAARRGGRLLARLSRWTRSGLSVPTADHRGRPVLAATTQVPVQVALLTGDCDAWLDDACVEATRHGLPVGSVWFDDLATVRHGLECDPCAVPDEGRRTGGRGWQPTLRESVAVDLVARFAAAVMITSTASVSRSLVMALAACGPLELPRVFGLWLDASRGLAAPPDEHREAVVTQWRRSVAAWHRETVRQPPVSPAGVAVCDALAAHFDAAARGIGVHVGRDLCELLALRPVAMSSPVTVLGHVSSGCSGDHGGARLICLGPAIGSRWSSGGTSRGPGLPPTVVRRDHDWERLQIPGVEGDDMLVPSTRPRPMIIDAA